VGNQVSGDLQGSVAGFLIICAEVMGAHVQGDEREAGAQPTATSRSAAWASCKN
jgi:hypothetical protein